MDSIKINDLPIESRATEHFDFGSSSYEQTSNASVRRNVRNEVSNKGFDPEAVIDAYEQAKGIRKKPRANDMSNYTFKNIILDPEQQKDQDMLNELMNNKKYMIISWKDTWTPQGTFRVFIIYGSKKDEKKNE
jgi:hypothetical protein